MQHADGRVVFLQNLYVRCMFVYRDSLREAFRSQAWNKIVANQTSRSSYYDFSFSCLCHISVSSRSVQVNRRALARWLWGRYSLPNGHPAEGLSVLIIFVEVFVQKRDSAASRTVIWLVRPIELGVQYDIRWNIDLEFLDNLSLNVIPVLQVGIEVRPSGRWQTMARKIDKVVICEYLVMVGYPNEYFLIRPSVAIDKFNGLNAVILR